MEDGRAIEAGQGQTIDIGSGGVLFSADCELSAGAFIELSISWPVQLDSGAYMRLVVFGRVLRSAHGACACTVDKYEFRTQARPIPATSGKGDTTPRRWTNDLFSREPKGGLLNFGLVGSRW